MIQRRRNFKPEQGLLLLASVDGEAVPRAVERLAIFASNGDGVPRAWNDGSVNRAGLQLFLRGDLMNYCGVQVVVCRDLKICHKHSNNTLLMYEHSVLALDHFRTLNSNSNVPAHSSIAQPGHTVILERMFQQFRPTCGLVRV